MSTNKIRMDYTALWYACCANYTEITEILLQNNKINVNLQNNYGYSPFYTVCWNDRYECSLLMLKDASGYQSD